MVSVVLNSPYCAHLNRVYQGFVRPASGIAHCSFNSMKSQSRIINLQFPVLRHPTWQGATTSKLAKYTGRWAELSISRDFGPHGKVPSRLLSIHTPRTLLMTLLRFRCHRCR